MMRFVLRTVMLRNYKINVVYIHILMMLYAWRKIGLFQTSDTGGLLFLVVSIIYFIYFFSNFMLGKNNTIFYGVISVLALIFLYAWSVPGPTEKLIFWFLSFPAWPILALAYYLYNGGVSWRLLFILYLLLVTMCSLSRCMKFLKLYKTKK